MDVICVQMYSKFIVLLMLVSFPGPSKQDEGHYRCRWVPDTADDDQSTQLGSKSTNQCKNDDSDRMMSYMNACTKKSFMPLNTCNDDGTWNCQTFMSFCKTLIKADSPVTLPVSSVNVEEARNGNVDINSNADSRANLDSRGNGNSRGKTDQFVDCANPTGYYTMKEMGAAVLASFIAGATMLAVVVLVVWKCRNSHWETTQRNHSSQRKESRIAALHALTHIANAFGTQSDTERESYVVNPMYAQTLATSAIMGVDDEENEYEEIATRKASTCVLNDDCLYAQVNKKRRRKSSISKIINVFKKPSQSVAQSSRNSLVKEVNNQIDTVSKKSTKADDGVANSNSDSGYMEEMFDVDLTDTNISEEKLATAKAEVTFASNIDDTVIDEDNVYTNRKLSVKF